MRWPAPLSLLAVLTLGCTSLAPAPFTAPLADRGELVELSVEEGGLDVPPARRVGFRFADGSLRLVDREAIAFVPRWREGAALVDPDARLYEVSPHGERRMLARGATGPLAVSDDGSRLAYTVSPGAFVELRVHDGASERTFARELSSAGVLRFLSDDEVAFVGARPGGIVGVWLADGAEARCLTNCDLRTGTPRLADFVPPPVRAASFTRAEGALSWVDPEGVRREVELNEGLP